MDAKRSDIGRKLSTASLVWRRLRSVSRQRSFRSADRDTIASGGELDTTDMEVYGAMLRTPSCDDVAISASGRGLAKFVNHRDRMSCESDSNQWFGIRIAPVVPLA